MATTYKTPGVYVEEISKLPPSVAQVETALPAFIGYTEKADELTEGDLSNVPTRIGSLVEYELYFGAGPSPDVSVVNIDSSNNFVSATVTNKFFMYDALQMFYANGGGDCYIVSIGESVSSTTVAKGDFTNGIAELEKEDAPTILLFPDAVTLNDDDIAAVQQAALAQCAKLGDRVGLFDVKQDDPLGANFRNKVGINDLKYGAVYTPWLQVNLTKSIKYTDIKSVIKRSNIGVSLSSLTTDATALSVIDEIDKAYTDDALITSKTNALNPPDGVLADGYNTLLSAFNAPAGNSDANLGALFDYVYSIGNQIDDFINAVAPNALTSKMLDNVKDAVNSVFDTAFKSVASINLEAEADITGLGGAYTATDYTAMVTAATWPNAIAAAAGAALNEATEDATRTAAVNALTPLFDTINTAYQALIISASSSYTATLESSLSASFPVYKSIITGVGGSMTVMPPSGAVAGVYAAVDRTRGVWKAPANVSLSNVLAPDTVFTATQLENLNVDAVAGKSVNAIRYFTGKGTLVFGARTLAGNDNEWRYVPVRRFFNMVEESCKKATEPFVFEPNDANTWVKIQGMIENFLTTLWRQGALQGIKPEHAFYVAVGLGKTMTSLDILEGRLIVEIGMAAVRPAEFIILRFSHKLAES